MTGTASHVSRGANRQSCQPGRVALALVFALLITGCGGKRGGDTAPTTGVATAGAEHESSDMVPADTMDEINRRLERKRQMVSRCLASAVDNKELPKNSAGKVTVEIVISPSGKVDTVHIVRTTLESKTLSECVTNRIKEIQFPEVPKPYETSYTYGFEAM